MDPIQNETLELLRAQLAEWRQTYHAPTPIPSEIWAKAAELAADLGVSAVSRELRLGPGRLRERMVARGAIADSQRRRPGRPRLSQVAVNGRRVDGNSQPSFVELLAPLRGHVSDCSFEVESATGRHLRVTAKNMPPAGLAAILREFAS